MKNTSARFQFRRTVQTAAVLTAFASTLLMAGSNSTTLSNGAALTVTVASPATGTEFQVPPGVATINVPVAGSASVGLGEAAASFIYVVDTSGSTDTGGGTGCSPILNCEKKFFVALNAAVAADGSTDEVGVVNFSDSATIRDMQTAGGHQNFTLPSDPHVNTVINGLGAGGGTNCTAALNSALLLVNAPSTNTVKNVVFASDGLCNTGGPLGPAATALAASGAIVNAIAIGSGSSCTTDGGTGRLNQIPANGGTCYHVADPGNLPDLISNLTGSTLQALSIQVDGGAFTPISATSLPLPQLGAVSVDFTASADNLAPGDHTICVKADGSDALGGTASVTQCETIHLLQLSASPATATNELGVDHTHTVTAHVAGDAAQVSGRQVSFVVGGQNGGATGTCTLNVDCKTDAAGNVSFTYNVPVAPASLGVDSITVTTPLGGSNATVTVAKRWADTTPPVSACAQGVNPGGNIPKAKNEDGYWQLLATDAVDPNPKLFVIDGGTGTVFGPYTNGTYIKYVQAPGSTPSASPGPGAVAWRIKGKGDMQLIAEDGSGNKSAPLFCLVPPPPK
ncbi:MAG TPA: VWA domain-containing protein [Vicinamibacterales bacterium]|nr:VWA domain-containing protein [Vicinamibacterales bacterium]